MAQAAPRLATYADLEAVPPHLVAEIVDGVLETHRRPGPAQSAAQFRLMAELGNAFVRGRTGPGGWSILPEPEVHLGQQIIVPNLAGWRRDRLTIDLDAPSIETPPDWVCEILSPSTRRLDLGPKRRIYGETGVPFLWFLDPDERTLEAFALTGGRWLLLGTAIGGEDVSLPPFDAITFPLDDLFPFADPAASAPPET